MSKLSSKWVVLCTAAIGLTYSAGYMATGTAALPASANGYTQTQNRHSATQSNGSAQSAGPSASSSNAVSSAFKDGSFTGQGDSQMGGVAVKVTIQQGKINAVEITQCTTSYPESVINGLPQQVVALQNANVDNVSGATFSSEAFKAAVSDALQKARA